MPSRLGLLLITCLFLFQYLSAGGFQVNLQGGKQTAMGHTGAALAMDPSILFFNPGGMSFIRDAKDRRSYSGLIGNVNSIFGGVAYREPAPGTYTASTEPVFSTPLSLYGMTSLGANKNWSLGIGVYTPFGSRVLYEDNWQGQFMLREISLRAFFVQPTVSYRINDKIGIGAGPVLATGSVLLRRALPLQFLDGTYGETELSGAGTGYGFNVGVYLRPSDKLNIGVTHRSSVNFNADNGQATFTVPDSARSLFPDGNFSASLKLPSTTTLGFTYKPNEKLTLNLDINYVGWSIYDTLAFDFEQNTSALDDLASAREYKNAFIFRLGGSYQLPNESLPITLRAGAYFDMTPVQDGYITPETPDAHKLGLSAGASFLIAERVNIDLSLLFVEGMTRTASNFETNFSGTFKARALVPGIGIGYVISNQITTPAVID